MYLTQLEKLYEEDKSPLTPLRQKALEKLKRLPFPDRTVEEYRKVVLEPLFARQFTLPDSKATFLETAPSPYCKVVLQNGALTTSLKNAMPFVVSSLEEAYVTYASFIQSRILRRIAEEEDFFALAVESFQEGGIFLYIPPKTHLTIPIHLIQQYQGKNNHIASKIQIVVGKESYCEIIAESKYEEFQESAALELFDVVLEKGATCKITDLNFGPKDVVTIKSVRALVKSGANFAITTATKGSSLHRFHYQVELAEEDASCDLQGVWQLREDRRAHFSGEVKHLSPHTRSNQHFKGVLLDKARSTFTGKIFVASPAQKTEAYQLNNNLVLSDGASAFTKPHLEIFADDVKASHGATVSQLSEEELFYMRSRGYKESLARQVLMRGFLEEILVSIPQEEIKNKVRETYAI
ncbi:MAG: Fe-S cluster assembly protein SufD [Verrucomicrobia bacterium]|nr:Fe-S cluster assembly protein SufD [Verrucomicrobiota bacterium]